MCGSQEMRLVAANDAEVPESSSASSGSAGVGAVVVVGVKLDARSKELLTWALVKAANSGDRVIALHVLDPKADKTSLLPLVETFNSVLAAYEGFCNLKQVDLKLKVCRGSPVTKILSREVNSCGAMSLVVGTSNVHHTLRSKISLARSCAKSLQKNVSVICVDNGKILFQRESSGPLNLGFRSLDASESRCKKRKTLSRSFLSLPPQRLSSSSSSQSVGISMPSIGSGSISMAPVPCKTQARSRSGWSLLRRTILRGSRESEDSSTMKSSVMQWILKLPSQQSVAAISPNQKQISSSNRDDGCSHLEEEKASIMLHSADTNSDAYSCEVFPEELKDIQEKYSTKCDLFSYQELSLATNNFIPEHLIGKGGSSQVYRGCLPGGREIAVKILKPSKDVLEHFVSEIEILTSLHHNNIISLVGFSYDENRLLLVYNLLSRGCLEETLHGNLVSGDLVGWRERYKIALGVAEALDSLHNAAKPVIHRDVKSSNILLSDDFEPQLSDFGLATWASSCSYDMDTSDVAGTFGYLAPEYFIHEKLNEKMDIYAFGVVLLELLSGRKPIDSGLPKDEESLVMWAKHILKEGKFLELQDPSLCDAYDSNQFENVVLAASLCIRHTPQSRPNISLVRKLLQGDSKVVEWARNEVNHAEDANPMNNSQSATDIQSFINLALLDVEDETASTSSAEQNISVEDYLRSRWSRSSSFD